jgi:hypothetical protein
MAENQERVLGQVEDFSKLSEDELYKGMLNSMYGSDIYHHVLSELQWRSSRRTYQATDRLVCATWVIVGSSVVLTIINIIKLLSDK